MNYVHVSEGLRLPVDVVTQTIAVLAIKGAGKSFLSRRLVEQLHAAGQQTVTVDPKGDWWGIRSSSDGKKPGLPILILGGERGDVALEPEGGEVVARLVVEERVSALIDLSGFRKHQVATFMSDFLESLYRLKNQERYRTPMMLVVDEADAIAPQKPMRGEERMLGAIEDIVRRGRQRGIGCTLVSQRSAVLNKNVLTQAHILVALRTIGPQDLKALDAWIENCGTDAGRAQVMDSLPSLPTGEAWWWAPSWPTASGILLRARTRPIETFDSGATPKVGQRRAEPKCLADVDLGAVEKQMADAVVRQKENDPRLLKKRVLELERQLANPPSMKVTVRNHRPLLGKADITRVERLIERSGKLLDRIRDGSSVLGSSIGGLQNQLTLVLAKARADDGHTVSGDETALLRTYWKNDTLKDPEPMIPRKPREDGDLGSGVRRVLVAIAQHESGVTREQLSVLTGYRKSSRATYLKKLKAAGYIVETDRIRVTAAGLKELGPSFAPLPTGKELRAHLLATLPPGEARILTALIAAYPEPIHRDRLGALVEYKKSSLSTYTKKLIARAALEHAGRGLIRASPNLF